MGILGWFADRASLGEVGVFSPGAIRTFGRGGFFGGVFRFLFRPRFEGWERLGEPGPFLVVVNHSGGGGGEVGVLAALWAETHARERKLAAMAHPLAFHVPGPKQFLRMFGAIPSTYAHASAALKQGIPVLVFPGGDHEAFRPIWQASRVDFNGRQGFLRLAREAGVPIVPIGIRGSHFTVPILWRSRVLPYLYVLPRLIGMKRFPITAGGLLGAGLLLGLGPTIGWPLAGLLAYGWLISPTSILLPQLPWPIRGRVGEPIPPEVLFGQNGERSLEEAYADVVAAVQGLVDQR